MRNEGARGIVADFDHFEAQEAGIEVQRRRQFAYVHHGIIKGERRHDAFLGALLFLSHATLLLRRFLSVSKGTAHDDRMRAASDSHIFDTGSRAFVRKHLFNPRRLATQHNCSRLGKLFYSPVPASGCLLDRSGWPRTGGFLPEQFCPAKALRAYRPLKRVRPWLHSRVTFAACKEDWK